MPTISDPAVTYTASPIGGTGPFEYKWDVTPNTGFTHNGNLGNYQASNQITIDWNVVGNYTINNCVRELNTPSCETCNDNNNNGLPVSVTSGGCADGAPSNLTAVATALHLVELDWTDNSASETGFQVDYSTDGSTWVLYSIENANITSCNSSNQGVLLSHNTTYFFRVKNLGTCNSNYSNTVSTISSPNIVQVLSTNATGNIFELNITWSDINPNLGTNLVTYQVEAAHTLNNCISTNFRSITTTSNLSHLINNLKANSPGNSESNNTYSIRVRVVNANSVASNWVSLFNQVPTLAIGGFIDNDPVTCAYWTN